MKTKTKFPNKLVNTTIDYIYSRKWTLLILILPFIKPATELTGRIDIIFDFLKIISFFVIFFSYFYKMRKMSGIIFSLFIFQFILVFSTLINNGELWWAIVQMLSVTCFCMLFELALKIDKKNALISFSIALLSMSILTSISMFVFYPDGMYVVKSAILVERNNFLWGFDNSSIFKIIPSLIISGVCFYKYTKKTYIMILISMFVSFSFIYVNSMTAAVICILFTITYTILLIIRKPSRFLNTKYLIPFLIVLFFIILAFNDKLGFIGYLAKKVNKGYSINSRFEMWSKSIEYIKNNPIFGYGFEFREIIKSKFMYDHVHNIFLDILYRGGFLTFMIYLYTHYIVIKNNKTMSKCFNIASLGLLCITVCGIMDYYNDQYLIFLLFVLGFYSLFIESDNNCLINIEGKNTKKIKVEGKNKMKKNKKIGILTFQRTANYGAQFQNFALQYYLKSKNISVETIDYKNERLEDIEKPKPLFKQKSIKNIIKYFKCHKYHQNKWNNFETFRDNYINMSNSYSNSNIAEVNNVYEYIIVGSDQVWNTDITGKDFNYYLSFVEDNRKKMSYAASFGYSKLPEDVKEDALNYLKQFQFLNLREKTGLRIIDKIKNNEKHVVLDPTFLLDKKQYEDIFLLNKKEINEKYIFVYMFDETEKNISFIRQYAQKNNYRIKFVRDGFKEISGVESIRDASPEEFLKLLYNAECVMTGSFHGICLSLIMKKQFYYNLNTTHNRNSRIVDLLDILDLSNRNDYSNNMEINFKKVDEKLNKEIKMSKDILNEMIINRRD